MITRTRVCPTCQGSFSYPMGPGNDRKHCSPECRVKHQKRKALERFRTAGKCALGCGRKANRRSHTICEACYYYERRTGKPGPAPIYRAARYEDHVGYVVVNVKGHPLAGRDGLTREHRVVAYDSNGGRCPNCFWCGVGLSWGDAVVDHLNEQKNDNRPSNLVVACKNCNLIRGGMLPFIARMSHESLEAFIHQVRQYHASKQANEAQRVA